MIWKEDESEPKERRIQVHDKEAARLFRKLEEFLGPRRVEHRLRQVAHEIDTERGTYLRCWVLPNRRWWLGLKEALDLMANGKTLRGRLNELMRAPLSTAANLSVLYRGMANMKREEFASRILTADSMMPVLFEIHFAAHFWQLGYEVEWVIGSLGERSPEFVGSCGNRRVEVECKTKSLNAGRRIVRPVFYRLVDSLAGGIASRGVMGDVLLSIPGRAPSTDEWRNTVAHEVLARAVPGETRFDLDDGTQIELRFQTQNHRELSEEEFLGRARQMRTGHSHVAVCSARPMERRVDPVLIRLASSRPDRFLDDVREDLHDAKKQLSGNTCEIIACFVPEVENFVGMETNSALSRMTLSFLERDGGEHIQAVVYVSDAQEKQFSGGVEGFFPSVIFRNPCYDESYGPILKLSGTLLR